MWRDMSSWLVKTGFIFSTHQPKGNCRPWLALRFLIRARASWIRGRAREAARGAASRVKTLMTDSGNRRAGIYQRRDDLPSTEASRVRWFWAQITAEERIWSGSDRRLHPYISRGAWDDKGGLEYNRLPYCFITVSGLDWQHTCLLSHPNISTQAVYDAFTLFGSHACCVCSIKQTRRIGVPSFTFLIYSDDQLIYGDWFYWYECYK